MPVRPVEVMFAKIVPCIVIGYVQAMLIMVIAAVVFGLPVRGSTPLLLFSLGLFIISNLALGITFSTVATTDAGRTNGAVHVAAVIPAGASRFRFRVCRSGRNGPGRSSRSNALRVGAARGV
jgi:ABC-type multidrug transport system permease subunit